MLVYIPSLGDEKLLLRSIPTRMYFSNCIQVESFCEKKKKEEKEERFVH